MLNGAVHVCTLLHQRKRTDELGMELGTGFLACHTAAIETTQTSFEVVYSQLSSTGCNFSHSHSSVTDLSAEADEITLHSADDLVKYYPMERTLFWY